MAERRSYDRSVLEAHAAYEISPLSDELAAKHEAAGWPEGLLERLLAVRPDRGALEAWLDNGFPTPEMLEVWAADRELQMQQTLVTRQATWEDNDLLVDLCDNAPERVDDWTVTVQRSPYPYAQYRLQEHQNIVVIEDQRVGLGMAAHSTRNTYIQGERTTAHLMSGWRVRDGFRGLGLGNLLTNSGGPGTSWFGLITYYFVRSGNTAASWIDKIEEEMADRPEGFEVDPNRLTASVTYFPNAGRGAASPKVRPVTEDDLPACLELINRTHAGLDLFRPYSLDYLHQRLDDPAWGPKPVFYPSVYGWAEHRVLEVRGEIVACGGLWDRGRDVREVWERGEETFTVDPTALMDFGFAEGHEADMAELIRHFLAETATLDRSGMLAPLEFLPELAAECDDFDGRVETRELHFNKFSMPDLRIDVGDIERPYTDLAYW